MTLDEALERIKDLETQVQVLEHQLSLEQLLNDNLQFQLDEARRLP